MIPTISTLEDAQRAAAAARYPPHGMRSFGPVRNYYSAQQEDSAAACFAMIETRQGLDNLEAIAATPGIDGLFVGPIDLALNLGVEVAAGMSSDMLEALDGVVAACVRHHKVPGCVALGDGIAQRLLSRGMRFLAIGVDVGYLERGARLDARNAALLKKGGAATS